MASGCRLEIIFMRKWHGVQAVETMSARSLATGERGRVLIILSVATAWGGGCGANTLIAEDFSRAGIMATQQAETLKALEAQSIHEAVLMKIPGVVGVGIGLSENGDHPAIHVFVNTANTLYSPAAIPKHLDGVPVRIIEGGDITAR